MDTVDTFDTYAADYRRVVDRSVGFVGQDLTFFTEAKIYHLRRIARLLERPLEDASVLDVGCGGGITDTYLSPHVGQLSGVDVSAEMVKIAAERNTEATYRCYDGHRLPFGAGTFDLTFAICVVHHVHPLRWDGFVSELWRVTRPGGVAVIIEHNPLNPLTRRSVNACPFDEDAVLVGPRRLHTALRRAGAPAVKHRYILFAPFGGDRTRAAEAVLHRLPLGAQHLVYARKDRP